MSQYISIETLNLNKLLGRDIINLNNKNAYDFLYDKKILITGGCGSIGSEIVRQLLYLDIQKLVIIDNSECGMFHFKNEINKLFPNNIVKWYLRDIVDMESVKMLFKDEQPNFVFHAAAYKHVPIMEDNPHEAIKVNIIGTKTIADIALEYNVDKFLFVSTDKAVNPTNVMGASKRISELYVLELNKKQKTEFIITRFGNVLGSSGSVIPTFIKNINENRNLEITHKDIIRYFMSIPEASQLVIQSITIGNGGEILLFDMGEPVKIIDLARNIIEMFPHKNTEIVITGLRPGEKLYEELLCKSEEIIPTSSEKIMILKQTGDVEEFEKKYNYLIQNYKKMSIQKLKKTLKTIVYEYTYITMNSQCWPQINDKMVESVTDILKSGKLNQWNNTAVKDFESKFAKHIDSKYAVAVFNGTVSLELCVKTLGLKEGDEVIVTSRTFLASASCVAWYGIKPVFVDVDEVSQNITLETIKTAITTKTKAVILVHLAGWPCDVKEICEYCKKKNIYTIEDCAQAHGAKYNGRHVGTWGDINAWSFCQDKIITTGGEGGMVTTNCPYLYKLAWSLKDHGKGYDTVFNTEHPPGFRWLHENIGTNWRMLPIQAVIGSHALDELENWTSHRTKIANIYNNAFNNIDGLRLTIPPSYITHAYYKYYFFIEPSKFKISRDEIIRLIEKEGIFIQAGSCGEIYKEKALTQFAPETDLPVAKRLFETSILLLCDPSISEDVAIKNAVKIKNILSNNIV